MRKPFLPPLDRKTVEIHPSSLYNVPMDVYVLELTPLLPRLEEAMALLPPDRREKAAHQPPESQLRSVGAGLLLRHFFGAAPVARTPRGKPYIEGERPFNLSHSGRLAALAIASRPVGVDVQVLGPVRENTVRRVLTEAEYAWQTARPRDGFIQLWTRKEAALKCLGVGLDRALSSFSVLPGEVPVLDGIAVSLHTVICRGAALSAASAGESAAFIPEILDVETLLP